MKPYLGPAGRPQYQSNLYRANMQGADHAGFIGYLLGELRELGQRVSDLEAKLTPLNLGEIPALVAVAAVAVPVELPAEVPAPPPTVPESKPAAPVREDKPIDTDALRHIVIELDEPPTKKRGK